MILLSHEYPPFIFGGIGTFVKNLAYGLRRQGIKVTVIAGYPVPNSSGHQVVVQELDGGVNVLRFPYPNIPPRQTMFQVLNFKRLYKVIKKIGADIIHGQGGMAFPAILNLQKIAPVVVTFHSNPKMVRLLTVHSLFRGGSFRGFLTYVIGYPVWMYGYRKEFMRSDAAVAVSRTLMEEMKCDFGEKENGKFLYIRNGVDVEKLQREYSSLSCDTEDKGPTLIFGGRLYWTKGVLYMLKLAYILRKARNFNWKMIIYGAGPLGTQVKKMISDYDLNNVIFRGLVDQDEFISAMRRATFIVVPSLYEACPMTLLEGMCLGKIPVVFNLPYALEFTENGKYGIVANSIKDMATKIELMYKNVDMLQFGNEIRNFARTRFNIENVASEYIDVYKKVANLS